MRSNGWMLALCAALLVGAGCGGNRTETTAENPETPTTTQSEVQVAQVELGTAVDAEQRVTQKTDSFKPGDTIYATVITNGAAPQAEIKARWTYEDGQVVDETTEIIAPQGNAATAFHVSKPDGLPAGKYKVEIFVNGVSKATEDFQVNAS